MQSEAIKIHTLYTNIQVILRSLLDCFLKRDYLEKTPLEKIQCRNPYDFLAIKNLYLGDNVTASISNNTSSLNPEELLTFRKRCLEFLTEECHEIYKRFDPNNQSTQTLKQLTVISPREVISKQHDSIAPLASNFPNLIASDQLNSLDTEWRMLRNVGLSNLNDLNIGEFWQRISHMRQIEPVSIFLYTILFCR
jgi:hypothetical protein